VGLKKISGQLAWHSRRVIIAGGALGCGQFFVFETGVAGE